jgi:hypothetical protein
MNDDWSYVQSARVLAQTGHIVYNGWAAPILGWQLYLGALFIKLFGPSFTSIRASTLLIAVITAFLTQRTLVRAGINSRNATIGTLTLALSPLFLPLALSFMTDIDSLFCVVLCLFACLRALQANTDRAVLAWLAFAALSNALGGTVRQIAWLGVLLMFPSACWLLRRRPYVLLSGTLLYAISIVFIFASLRWFRQQPYSIPEVLIESNSDFLHLAGLALPLLIFFLTFAMFLLPILIAFVPAVSPRSRRMAVLLAICGVLCLPLAIHFGFPYSIRSVALPIDWGGNYVTPHGLVYVFGIKGTQPAIFSIGFRLLLSIAVLFALLCFLTFLPNSRRTTPSAQADPRISLPSSPSISWRSLLVLLLPFTVAYTALLIPRGLRGFLFDRYLLLLLPIGLILLLRLYQDRVRPNLPVASVVLVLLFAAFAVAGTHDVFSMYRAQQAAIDELRAAGIPDSAIDGGFEHNSMTQIQLLGHVNDPPSGTPIRAYFTHPLPSANGCHPDMERLIPIIVPGYTLSFNPAACGGLSSFAPVTYRHWLPARTISIYVVKTEKPASAPH